MQWPAVVAAAGGGGGGDDSGGGGFDYSKTLLARALNLAGAIRERDWMNLPKWHAAEMPAANGITNAVSLSRLYAGLTGTVEGGPSEPLLTKEEIEKARTVLTFGEDRVFASVGMPMSQKIGLGYWVASPEALYGGEGAFGHSGAGGSYGFADPETQAGRGLRHEQDVDRAARPTTPRHRLVDLPGHRGGAEILLTLRRLYQGQEKRGNRTNGIVHPPP